MTAVCSDVRRTLRFYRGGLGFRLVKKTVNFDDPGSYHLYVGAETGAPGMRDGEEQAAEPPGLARAGARADRDPPDAGLTTL